MIGRTRAHAMLVLALGTLVLGAPSPLLARTQAPDGTLLSDAPCEPPAISDPETYIAKSLESFDKEKALAQKAHLPAPITREAMRAALEARGTSRQWLILEGFECHRITYASDGLVIAGLLWKPPGPVSGTHPLIIYNRGGNRTFGPATPYYKPGWLPFLKAGYVIMASQYRGGPGSEGEDEFGGRDTHDVWSLLALARTLPYIDTGNVFLMGRSRGGIETFVLARQKFPARAMAVWSGVADQGATLRKRPNFDQMFRELIPGYSTQPQAALEARSGVKWANEISIPTLLLHGTADWRVAPSQSLAMAGALLEAGTPVELHLYEGDDHALDLHLYEGLEKTLAWFDAHLTPEAKARRAEH